MSRKSTTQRDVTKFTCASRMVRDQARRTAQIDAGRTDGEKRSAHGPRMPVRVVRCTHQCATLDQPCASAERPDGGSPEGEKSQAANRQNGPHRSPRARRPALDRVRIGLLSRDGLRAALAGTAAATPLALPALTCVLSVGVRQPVSRAGPDVLLEVLRLSRTRSAPVLAVGRHRKRRLPACLPATGT